MVNQTEAGEDRRIRKIWIGLGVGTFLALLLAVLTVAVLIAVNFNILEWME